jgi:predicted RNA polymerase sigma factor
VLLNNVFTPTPCAIETPSPQWEGAAGMIEHTVEQVRERVDAVYRLESRRIFATLIRLLGDFELAEDALHDAFSAALERWPKEGVPASPRAWLVSAGRFRAIDTMRRRARFDASQVASRSNSELSLAARRPLQTRASRTTGFG